MPDLNIPEEAVRAAMAACSASPYASIEGVSERTIRDALSAAIPHLPTSRGEGGSIVETTAGDVRVGDELLALFASAHGPEWLTVERIGTRGDEAAFYDRHGAWASFAYKRSVLVRRGDHS